MDFPERKSYASHLECVKCKQKHDLSSPHSVCSYCQNSLSVIYLLEQLKVDFSFKTIAGREPTMWRYWELLPLRNAHHLVTFGEGFTPLLKLKPLPNLSQTNFELFLKDESRNPTGTFKARGAAVGVSLAKELGVIDVVMPSNGNAASAWAAYCANAGIRAHLFIPKDAPEMNFIECTLYGAEVELIDGTIADAGRIVSEHVRKNKWYNASTLKEPYRIEGKKTMGFEIAEQLGWNLPDVIIYPAGGGVGMIGIHKAFNELTQLGWVPEKPVRFVIVQSSGCAPLVSAFQSHQKETKKWENPDTVAFGMRVPKPLGDFMILDRLYQSNGIAIAVSENEIGSALKYLARVEGLFVCPEGAAAFAAIEKLPAGWIKKGERVVIVNTGTGLKYSEAVKKLCS
jgi:threonine synthase